MTLGKLPNGCTGFHDLRQTQAIYVDKTDLIDKMVTGRRLVFLSRPRRFGKSLLVSTLHSLFSKGLEDFKGLKIEKTWKEEKTYKIIEFNFTGLEYKESQDYQLLIKRLIGDALIKSLNCADILTDEFIESHTAAEIFSKAMETVSETSSLVLLVDEYDAPLTNTMHDDALCSDVHQTLKALFEKVKLFQPIFRFIFITGVCKYSNTSIFSGFNSLKDISMANEFSELLGYTEDELHEYFHEYVENAAKAMDTTSDEIYEKLKLCYDGYQFAPKGQNKLYNPWSVLCFLDSPSDGYMNYWYNSAGRPMLLLNRAPMSDDIFDKLKKLGASVPVELDELFNPSEKMKDMSATVLMYQTGYLTIIKKLGDILHLGLPNQEVKCSFAKFLVEYVIKPKLTEHEKKIQLDLYETLENGDAEEIAQCFSIFLRSLSPGSTIFDNENACRDVIDLGLSARNVFVSKEKPNSLGYSDLEIEYEDTKYVFEFKLAREGADEDKLLAEAVAQIKDRDYGCGFPLKRHLLRYAMVISQKEKKITKAVLVTEKESAD